jgi:hypothetical protein
VLLRAELGDLLVVFFAAHEGGQRHLVWVIALDQPLWSRKRICAVILVISAS